MTVIGIDLGTSSSAAAVLRGGRPVIIPDADGASPAGKSFPSCVAITAGGQLLVGEPARRQAAANPEGTIGAFKRRLGQRESIRLRDRVYAPEQLSAFLLLKIKRDAEAFLGETVKQAVVTVPASFNNNQRAATRDACQIAGLEDLCLLNEPSAAALAYGFDRLGQALRIVVIGLGGGMLDVSILELSGGRFEVKATSGDPQLGGIDMDQRVFEYLAERFRAASGVDVHHDPKVAARLSEAAEAARIDLSTGMSTHLSLPWLGALDGRPHHLELDFKRNELERLLRPLMESCRGPVEQALADAGCEPRDINRLVFAGGPTRMPVVQSFFEKLFVRKAEKGVDPLACVAAGAAIHASALAGETEGIVLADVTPQTLGIETQGGIATPLIARNTPLPAQRGEIFTTAVDRQGSVNIHVVQGDQQMASDNASVGEFMLDGLPAAPRGVPKIRVCFQLDASGLLDVAAQDAASGQLQTVRVVASTRLADEDKQRMRADAAHALDSGRQRPNHSEKLEAADMACREGEKLLAHGGEQLGQGLRHRLENALREARKALASKDVDGATERLSVLNKVLQIAEKALYDQAAFAPPAHGNALPDGGPSGGEARPDGGGPPGPGLE